MSKPIELTQQEIDERQEELQAIEEQLVELLRQQRVAKEFGDLSENAEYEIATREAKSLQKRKDEILQTLDNCVLVEPDNWPQISLGCVVRITMLDDKGNPIREPRLLRVASEGDSVQKKTLGINSPLGKAIMNGTDGIYTIQTVNGGVIYDVRKESSYTKI